MVQSWLNQDNYNHPAMCPDTPENMDQSQLNQDSYSENTDQSQPNQDIYNDPACALGNMPEKPRSVTAQPGQLQ